MPIDHPRYKAALCRRAAEGASASAAAVLRKLAEHYEAEAKRLSN
jgi:hypothetical protein